jgi:putative ABC transport system permease protein
LKIRDIALLSVESLSERKFRFALNLIGILIGCAAVTGLVSITQGLSNDINEQLEIFGPQNIMVIPGQIQEGRGIVGSTLGWRDLEIVSKVREVKVATPIIANKMVRFNMRGREYFVEVFGVTNEYFEINKNAEVEDGRALLRTDNAVVVVGANIAQPLDEDEAIVRLGDRLKIEATVLDQQKTLTLRVVGVYERTGGSFGADLDNSIGIPLRTAQQFFEVGGEFDYIMENQGDRGPEGDRRQEQGRHVPLPLRGRHDRHHRGHRGRPVRGPPEPDNRRLHQPAPRSLPQPRRLRRGVRRGDGRRLRAVPGVEGLEPAPRGGAAI